MKIGILELFSHSIEKGFKLTNLYRVDKSSLFIEFNFDKRYLIDMKNNKGMIYKIPHKIKDVFGANGSNNPNLKRILGSNVLNSISYKDNRIWELVLETRNRYKRSSAKIVFEFLNRQANIYAVSENGLVEYIFLNNYSSFSIGDKYHLPDGVVIDEEKLEIDDIDSYLEDNYLKIQKQKEDIKKGNLRNRFIKKIDKLNKLLLSLDDKEALEKNSEKLYKDGKFLLANISKLNYYPGMKTMLVDDKKIDINSSLDTVQRVIDDKFNKAKKMKRKSIYVFKQFKNIEENISFLKDALENIDNMSLKTVEIVNNSTIFNKNRDKKYKFETFFFDNIKVSIGKNQAENIELLKESKANDIWLHLKDRASAHAIVHSGKNLDIKRELIKDIAKLLLDFSKVTDDKYEVDFTKRKNVKILKNRKASYVKYDTIIVEKGCKNAN